MGVERFTLSPRGSLAELRGAGYPGAVTTSTKRPFYPIALNKYLFQCLSVCTGLEALQDCVSMKGDGEG